MTAFLSRLGRFNHYIDLRGTRFNPWKAGAVTVLIVLGFATDFFSDVYFETVAIAVIVPLVITVVVGALIVLMFDSSIARGTGLVVGTAVVVLWHSDYDFNFVVDYNFDVNTVYTIIVLIAIAVIIFDWSIKFGSKPAAATNSGPSTPTKRSPAMFAALTTTAFVGCFRPSRSSSNGNGSA
jgi:hypothetical protein